MGQIDTLAIRDRTVAPVVRFIREHTNRPIGIGDVLKAVPVSRRALERAFRRVLMPSNEGHFNGP